jgi:hypothetical protein
MEFLGFLGLAVVVLGLVWALGGQVKDAQKSGYTSWGSGNNHWDVG